MDPIILSYADHANLIIAAFKQTYPRTTVYKRMSRYSMGASLHITYVDGPPLATAHDFLNRFKTRQFDIVRDYDERISFEYDGRRYRGGIPYLHVNRLYSRDLVTARANELMTQYAVSLHATIPARNRSPWRIATDELEHRDLRHLPAPEKNPIPFSHFKERFHVGQILDIVHPVTLDDPTGSTTRREIVKVQTNAIQSVALDGPRKSRKSYLDYPRFACRFRSHDEDSFTILDEYGIPRITVRIVADAASAAA